MLREEKNDIKENTQLKLNKTKQKGKEKGSKEQM
jgi:DNA invertase Pin-like site-specific DNA recombinase